MTTVAEIIAIINNCINRIQEKMMITQMKLITILLTFLLSLMGCSQQTNPLEIPPMTDALINETTETQLSYVTQQPMDDVLLYYDRKMVGTGWSLLSTGNATVNGSVSSSWREYLQDGKQTTIEIREITEGEYLVKITVDGASDLWQSSNNDRVANTSGQLLWLAGCMGMLLLLLGAGLLFWPFPSRTGNKQQSAD